MKKYLALVCLLALLLSLCACAPAEQKPEGEDPGNTTGSTEHSQPTENSQPTQCAHAYEETVTVEANCKQEGVRTFTCNKCGDSYTGVILQTGHAYEMGKCTVCGDETNEYKALGDGEWVFYELVEGDAEGETDSLHEYCLNVQDERFTFGYYEEAWAYPSMEAELDVMDKEWVGIPLGAPWAEITSVKESGNTVTLKTNCMETATVVLKRISGKEFQVTSVKGEIFPAATGVIEVGTVLSYRSS